MQTKAFSIRLDMQQALPFHPFEVVEGDTGNVLAVTLLSDGEPMLLNDCAIVVAFTSSSGFAMQDETTGVTIGEDAGTFSILLDPNSYGPGNVSADVQVYSGPGNRVLVTSTRFDFRCRCSLISEEIIRANAAYPPLISATLACEQAAQAANAAADRISTGLGELNVQADWDEADSASDAYIRNKPQTPWDLGAPEEIHAYQHASGGDDPITPSAIEAVGYGAAQALTSAEQETARCNIGAAGVSARSSATLAAKNWAGTAAPYAYTLEVAGVTAASAVEVFPSASVTAEQLAAMQSANIVGGAQSAGSIELRAFGGKPIIALPVQIIVRGDLPCR